MEAVLLGMGINLASTLLVSAGGRLKAEALGDEQEQALRDAFAGATGAMLVEMARHARRDRDLPGRLEERFERFFRDEAVASKLVAVALDSEVPPVDWLRRRYEGLGLDPGELPIGFGRAMGMFARELAERVREDARVGGPLAGIVLVADVEAMRGTLEELARARGATGPDVDELERESFARCAERWVGAGVPPEEARSLAADATVGAPGPGLRAALSGPLAVVAGEVGAGKSLLLDRLLQRAVVGLREEPEAPLPAYLEAWEVDGRLRDAVLEKTSSLGNARVRGARVFVDGAEEAGQARARRLVGEARILAEAWPNTAVVVAGRPLPELTDDREVVRMPELTEGQTKSIIERVSGEELRVAITYKWPESVAEAVKRPLFATLVGVDLRERGPTNPRSTGELLSSLVDRALKKSDEAVDVGQLRSLAAASMDRGAAPVRARDVGTGEDVRRMLSTGLIAQRDGTVSFSLRLLAEWFAAQALEHGLVDTSVLASDPARLERWRYPLAVAVGTFGYSRVKEIFGPIVVQAPAFASQVVEAAIEKGYVGLRLSRESHPISPGEFGRQLKESMGAWVDGIGPLAPLVAPVRGDGSLATLGLSGSGEQVYSRSWYRGEDHLGEVVDLSQHLPGMLPNWEWRNVRGVGGNRQAAWVWEYAFQDLRKELEEILKKRKLPVSGGFLAEEAAWDAAREMRKRIDGKAREREPIPLEAVEGYLDFVGRDTDAITFGNQWDRPGQVYDLGYLKDKVRDLRDAGEDELRPPWPMYDRMPGDPGHVKTGRKGAWVWEWYSPDALLARARVIMEGALDGYRRFVEEFFPRLAPHLTIAATLPARLSGTLVQSHSNEWTDSTSPYVAWYLDPLPRGSASEVRVEIGRERESDERMLEVLRRTQNMRPGAAGWISSPEYADRELFGKTPATELAYEWLWNDLRRVSWVDGMFNRRYS